MIFTNSFMKIFYNTINFFVPAGNDRYIPDVFLRELIDRMSKDYLEPSNSYIDPLAEISPPAARLALISRASKDLENEQLDYDALLDGDPNPSLRDQEYLQHSTLWGHQYISGGGGDLPSQTSGKQEEKTDAGLPAYCNPPNPCPVGYTADQGCLEDFENTAAFSREYQAAQQCMCDGEHMFECHNVQNVDSETNENGDLESFLAEQYHAGTAAASVPSSSNQKNLISKKAMLPSYASNPYLQGEKLPIAAKKGLNMY